ncbi:Syntaxin-1A, partial [Perkinsus olseni]
MVQKDRTEELRQRARRLGVIPSIDGRDIMITLEGEGGPMMERKQPQLGRMMLSWLNLTAPSSAAATKEERLELMSSFFDEVVHIRKSLDDVRQNIKKIRDGQDDMAKVVSIEKETMVRREVEDVITVTNKIITTIKNNLQAVHKRNEEFMEVAPKAVADMRMRDGIYTGLCTKFNNLVLDYQTSQSDFTRYAKARAFNNLHMALPEATADEIHELLKSGVRPSSVLQQKMMMRDGTAIGRADANAAHVTMITRLQQMQDKYSDLRRLEEAVVDLHQLFVDMAIVVNQQVIILDD